MDLKELEKIIKLVEKSNINQIKLEENGVKIEIVKEEIMTQSSGAHQVMYQPMQQQMPQPQPVAVQPADVETKNESEIAANEIAITSPMVGTFYASSSPESPAFVKIGDRVNVGNPVCIIEAMKLFNEIEAECAGTVVKVLVKNEQAVEFGQTLFILKKDA
ncbi:MAG: acetyl-CoA carboxylase, biotin carboxyl carrier protein [Candidatus Margulisbacteria bacterium GWF2_35_9]|nr:MAG: acetyl-CoA carboxylase, biotin carboxyl carrier protein [Candidatus Margulisbacteria bacterium GWF2_35_9]